MPRVRALSAVFVAFGVSAALLSSEVRAQHACAYVAGPGALTAVHVPSAEFAYRIPIGWVGPQALAISDDLQVAFLAGPRRSASLDRSDWWGVPLPEDSVGRGMSAVVAVDLRSGRVTELTMEGAEGLLVDPTGRRLLVARAGDSRIYPLPLRESAASVDIPSFRAAAFSEDGTQLFLATAEAQQRILVVDTASGTVERALVLPEAPKVAAMVKVSGGNVLILQPELTAAMLRLDLATGALGPSLTFEGNPYSFRFRAATRVPLLAAAYLPPGRSPRLQFIDGLTLRNMAQVEPALEGPEFSFQTSPFDLSVSAGGELLVLTGEAAFLSIPEDPVVHASFSVLDRTKGEVVHRRSVGPFGQPHLALSLAPCPDLVPCIGDCNGDHAVSVDELVLLVNIVIGEARAGVCLAGEQSGDGVVSVDEIISAVGRALDGC